MCECVWVNTNLGKKERERKRLPSCQSNIYRPFRGKTRHFWAGKRIAQTAITPDLLSSAHSSFFGHQQRLSRFGLLQGWWRRRSSPPPRPSSVPFSLLLSFFLSRSYATISVRCSIFLSFPVPLTPVLYSSLSQEKSGWKQTHRVGTRKALDDVAPEASSIPSPLKPP